MSKVQKRLMVDFDDESYYRESNITDYDVIPATRHVLITSRDCCVNSTPLRLLRFCSLVLTGLPSPPPSPQPTVPKVSRAVMLTCLTSPVQTAAIFLS